MNAEAPEDFKLPKPEQSRKGFQGLLDQQRKEQCELVYITLGFGLAVGFVVGWCIATMVMRP